MLGKSKTRAEIALTLLVCFRHALAGLIIGTLAVELGSVYVKRIYYVGREYAGHFARVQIWFGAKQ